MSRPDGGSQTDQDPANRSRVAHLSRARIQALEEHRRRHPGGPFRLGDQSHPIRQLAWSMAPVGLPTASEIKRARSGFDRSPPIPSMRFAGSSSGTGPSSRLDFLGRSHRPQSLDRCRNRQ